MLTVGKTVAGYDIPVVNERAMRAAAGILLLFGGTLYIFAVTENNPQLMQPFGIFFLIDMMIRVTLSERFSPSVLLGTLFVYRQQPEWVGAAQKEFAWWLGMLLAMSACLAMGFFAAGPLIPLILCGICVTLLFFETAFGICVGCTLYRWFVKKDPQYCPGGRCEVSHHRHEH